MQTAVTQSVSKSAGALGHTGVKQAISRLSVIQTISYLVSQSISYTFPRTPTCTWRPWFSWRRTIQDRRCGSRWPWRSRGPGAPCWPIGPEAPLFPADPANPETPSAPPKFGRGTPTWRRIKGNPNNCDFTDLGATLLSDSYGHIENPLCLWWHCVTTGSIWFHFSKDSKKKQKRKETRLHLSESGSGPCMIWTIFGFSVDRN